MNNGIRSELMKKGLLALITIIFICGCTPVSKMNLDEIIDSGVQREIAMANQNRKGYKYYVPRGMKVIDYTAYNERLSDTANTYYLYIDAISYLNRVIEDFEINEEAYYSKPINYEDKFGYLEIKKMDSLKYLVEIMYNYAKIEVIVEEEEINDAVFNSLTILSSITYNNTILNNLLGDNVLQFKETEFNIFEPKDDSNYLQAQEEDENKYIEEEIHDGDLIN